MIDVDVTPANSPYYITDGNRTFGTVTIHPGGYIYVQTAAVVTIASLKKVDQ